MQKASHRRHAPGSALPVGATRRVWIFNHYADAPDRAGGRHFALGLQLVAHGLDVTIFAAGFDHLTQQEVRATGFRLSKTRSFRGVRFVWLRTVPYRGNSWRRIANMLSYSVMVVVAQIGRNKPDVIIGSSVHPLAALAAWFVARLRGARFAFEIRDLWPQTLVDLGAVSARSLSARALWALESFLVREADAVIGLVPGTRAYLAGRRLPTHHVYYLPNGVDLDDAGGDGKDSSHPVVRAMLEEIARRRTAGEFVLIYLGSHGRVNRLDVVLAALQLANRRSRRPIGLILVGDGPEKARLRRLARRTAIDRVSFRDPVPKYSVPTILAAVDAGVIHTTRTPVYRYGISFNKLFDYLAARKPVVFACETAYDPVRRSGAGLVVAPDDPDAMAAAFVDLSSRSPDELRSMGAAGRSLVEREHDLRRLGERLVTIIGTPLVPTE